MLGLNGTIDQLAVASIVHWYDHLWRRADDDVLRHVLKFLVEDQTSSMTDMEEAG